MADEAQAAPEAAAEQAAEADAPPAVHESQASETRLDELFAQAAAEAFSEQAEPTEQAAAGAAPEPEAPPEALSEPKTAEAASNLEAAQRRLKRQRAERQQRQELERLRRENAEAQELLRSAKADPDGYVSRMLQRAGITAEDWHRSLEGRKDPDPAAEVRQLRDEVRREREERAERDRQLAQQAHEGSIRRGVVDVFRAGGERWALVAAEASDEGDLYQAVKSRFLEHHGETGEHLSTETILDEFEGRLRERARQQLSSNAALRKLAEEALRAPGQQKVQPSKTGVDRRPATLTSDHVASPSGARQRRQTADEVWNEAVSEIARNWG